MSITDTEDERMDKEEEVRKRRKALRIVTGGKGPPPPDNENGEDWLSPMKRFTIFLASSPKLGLDLLEYHVIVKTKKSIKLAVNEGQIVRWVDPKDFCKKFILHEIIQIPVEEKDE